MRKPPATHLAVLALSAIAFTAPVGAHSGSSPKHFCVDDHVPSIPQANAALTQMQSNLDVCKTTDARLCETVTQDLALLLFQGQGSCLLRYLRTFSEAGTGWTPEQSSLSHQMGDYLGEARLYLVNKHGAADAP